MKIGVFGSRL